MARHFALIACLLSGVAACEPAHDAVLAAVPLQDDASKEDTALGKSVSPHIRKEVHLETLSVDGVTEVLSSIGNTLEIRGDLYVIPEPAANAFIASIGNDSGFFGSNVGFMIFQRLGGRSDWSPLGFTAEITTGFGFATRKITFNYFSAAEISRTSFGFVAPRVGAQSLTIEDGATPREYAIFPIPTDSWGSLEGSYTYHLELSCSGVACK